MEDVIVHCPLSKINCQHRRAFTLLELFLAIGAFGVVASIVILAMHPGRQLGDTRNMRRYADINTIANAIELYANDNGAAIPSGIDFTLRMIGTATGACSVQCGTPVVTTTVTLSPIADTSLWQAHENTNYGADAQLWVYPWTPNRTRRALVRFDLSSIPLGAMIQEAHLFLHEATTYGSLRTIGAYRITRNWQEGEATWKRAERITGSSSAGNVLWTTPGGDAVAVPTGTATLSWDGILGWNSWDVRSDLQSFVNGTYTNYGWLMKDVNEDTSQAYWFFHSRESTNASRRPYLSITYTMSTPSPCLSLTGAFVPTYLPSIPFDPLLGSPERSYYAIQETPQRNLVIRSCAAELEKTIEVTR